MLSHVFMLFLLKLYATGTFKLSCDTLHRGSMANGKGVINTCLAIVLDTVYALCMFYYHNYSIEYIINVKVKIFYLCIKMYL